jgi:hypothetical protein
LSAFLWIAAAIGAAYVLISEFGETPAVAASAVPLVVAGALVIGRKRALARERALVTEERAAHIDRVRRAAIEEATTRALEAESARDSAKETADRAREAYENAVQVLRAAKEAAAARYVSTFPEPWLPPGVRPESAYLDSPPIVQLRAHGYGFGHAVSPEDGSTGPKPIDVQGLVSSESQPETHRRTGGTRKTSRRRSSR